MSTKLYVVRVRRKEFWPFVASVKRLYHARHFELSRHREMVDLLVGADTPERQVYLGKKLLQAREDATKGGPKAVDENDTVEIQCFDRGPFVYVRVLEQGWTFWNHIAELDFAGRLDQVVYDDRTDVPKEHRLNARHQKWIDERIGAGEFALVPIVTKDRIWWGWMRDERSRVVIQSLCAAGHEVDPNAPWTPQERLWIADEARSTAGFLRRYMGDDWVDCLLAGEELPPRSHYLGAGI